MIVVNKPFRYLRDAHQWFYTKCRDDKRRFVDPSQFMLLERKELMSCKSFQDEESNKTTEDAHYKTMDLLTFFSKCILLKDSNEIHYKEGYWNYDFIKFGLKIIRNAEIGVPTKENFPLIIRNDSHNLYIAPKIEEEVS